jgi:hypothetical protein
MADLFFGVPEPALQATAMQLSRTMFKPDKSFGYSLLAICFAVVEELL